MKKIILFGLFSILTACSNSYSEINYPNIPNELKSCKFYFINNEQGSNMHVAYCPGATTTTINESEEAPVVTINGKTYSQNK